MNMTDIREKHKRHSRIVCAFRMHNSVHQYVPAAFNLSFFAATLTFADSLFVQGIVQRDGELVGARSAAAAAVVALEQGRYILGVSAFEQLADGTEIARAAADEAHIVELALLVNGKRDLLGTDTLRGKGIRLHDFTFFLKYSPPLYAIHMPSAK